MGSPDLDLLVQAKCSGFMMLFFCLFPAGFSGPLWPHKEGGKTPGPGPGAEPGAEEAPTSATTPAALPGPSFDTSDIPTTVHARPGQTVFLPCRVRNRGDNVVGIPRGRPSSSAYFRGLAT